MASFFEHLSEEEQEKLMRFRNSLPQIKQQLFDIFFHTSEGDESALENVATPEEFRRLNVNTSEEAIQQFLDATIFKQKKGMLAVLNEKGNIERSSVDEHQISLKHFANSFGFFQEHLEKNKLGKQIIPLLIQRFVTAIDEQLAQYSSEVLESPDAEFRKNWDEIRQEWEKSKDDLQRKKGKLTLTEFGRYVGKLFSGQSNPKAPLGNLDIAPKLGEIYHKVQFSVKDILQELEQTRAIPAKKAEHLFEKGTKWGDLEICLDCIVTGDNERQLERMQEKKKQAEKFQSFFTATIPDLQDLMRSLPIPPQTPEERNKLIRKNIVQRNNDFLQSIPKDDIDLNVAMKNYMETVKDKMYTLLDLTQKEIKIETPGGTLIFPVEKRIGDGQGMLDMKFVLTIPDEAEAFLSAETSPLRHKFFTVVDKSGQPQKITEDYVVELTDNQGNKKTGKLTETLDPTLKNPYPPEVQQKIDTEGEDNLRFLVDEQGNPLAAYTDEELKQHTLNVKDKKLQLAGEDLQRFVGQVLTMQVGGFESHSDKSEKKIAKFLDNMPKPATDVPVEEAETQRANFLTYFQDMKGHPFGYDKLKDNQHNVDNQKLSLEEIKKREEEAGLKKGTRLWINTGRESELPPQGKDGDQRIQMEIVSTSADSVKVKLSGGELGLGSLEGKIVDFPKDEGHWTTFLEKFANGAGGDIYKLPPATNGTTLQDCMKTIQKTNMFGDYWGTFLDQSIVFKDNEILFNLGEEKGKKVEYFGLQDELTDKRSQNVHYKIEYLSNGKIKVTSTYLSKVDGNKKEVFEEKGYSREMDYNNFLIFIATKHLKPKTKAQQEEEEESNKIQQKSIPLSQKGLKWWSFNNIIHTAENCRKKIKGLVDEYSKEKDDDFMNLVVGEWGLYKHLGNLFGAVGWTGGAEATAKADMEHWNERDNRVWKKIQKWLDIFDKDPDFGDTVNKAYLPQFLGGKSIIGYISSQKGLITDEKQRYFVAAAYLANINKGGGPYARMAHLQFTGHWVKLLLGKEHHERFVRQYKLQKAEFDDEKGEHKTKDGHIMDTQAKAEMLYIVNQLDERGGDNDSFFGFQQGIKPSNKRRLSAKFATELETRYKDYISEEKLNEGVSKQRGVTNFKNAYNEFKRYGLSNRPGKALPYIQRMAEMAKTSAQFSKLQEVLLFGLTSGYFRFLPHSWKGRLEKLSRSMAFTPGMMAIEARHPEKIAHLLDVLTEGKFSKETQRKWSRFDNNPDEPKEGKDKEKPQDFYKDYFNAFDKFWNKDGMSGMISDGIQKLHLRDPKDDDLRDPKDDEVIAYIQQREFEPQVDHINDDILGNGRLAKWNALGKTKGTFAALTKYSNGKFDAKDADMEQAMEDFWGGVNSGITSYGSIDPKHPEKTRGLTYLMKKVLFNWFENYGFDQQGKEKLARTLGTVVQLHKKKVDDAGFSITDNNLKQILEFMVYGRIFAQYGSNPPKEVKTAIKNLTNVLWNHIKAGNIDESFIGTTFADEYTSGDEYKIFFSQKRYQYLHQEQYNRIENSNSSDKEAQKLKSDLRNLDEGFVNNEMRSIFNSINSRGGNSLGLNLGVDAYDEEGKKHVSSFLERYKKYHEGVATNGGTPPSGGGGKGDDDDDDDENNQ